MSAKPILLVGNGINRIEKDAGPSWEEVLRDLRTAALAPNCLQGTHKPYTIYFEELYNRAANAGVKEGDFQTAVAAPYLKLTATAYHRRLLAIDFSHLLTTNYDLTFEEALDARPVKPDIGNRWNISESKFSLFRRTRIGKRWLWHIHGESQVPSSIMLGHDHYVNYAGRLREYWNQGVSYASVGKITRALRRDPKLFDSRQAKRPYTWLDLFVRNPVHICGLSFDFSETVLWYALSRRRLLSAFSKKSRQSDIDLGAGPMDEVFFHYFEKFTDDPKSRALLEVLESMQVTCVPHALEGKDYAAAWDRLLTSLEKSIGKVSIGN